MSTSYSLNKMLALMQFF